MARVPEPRSFEQIRRDLANVFVADSGVNDLNPGSSVNSFLEATALSQFRSQADIISVLNVNDIDNAEGIDLDNIGEGKGVRRPQATAAVGVITIFQKDFTKVSTKVYLGTAAPPAGSLTVNVSDASLFPATGSIFLGQGTANLEGPIAYTSITPVGSFF